MINLGKCISFLLDRHLSVPVSGLGTFYAVHADTEFDVGAGTYQIPARKVSFIADPDAGSSLMVDYVAAQRQIPEAEAKTVFGQAVAAFLEELTVSGRARLDGLGTVLSQDDMLVFEALPGADPFSNDGPVPAIPVSTAESLELEQEARTRVGMGFWAAAALVLGLAAVLAVGLWWFRPDLTDQFITQTRHWVSANIMKQQSLADTGSPEAASAPAQHEILIMPADSSATDTLDAVVLEESLPLPDPPLPVIGPVVSYEIIVGSFATMQQAEKYVAQMKDKGINLRAIDSKMPGNRKKISFGSYATEAAAYQALAEVQRTLEPTAWVARVER